MAATRPVQNTNSAYRSFSIIPASGGVSDTCGKESSVKHILKLSSMHVLSIRGVFLLQAPPPYPQLLGNMLAKKSVVSKKPFIASIRWHLTVWCPLLSSRARPNGLGPTGSAPTSQPVFSAQRARLVHRPREPRSSKRLWSSPIQPDRDDVSLCDFVAQILCKYVAKED